MKIKIERRVSLTPRDILLLHELYGNVMLSFPQVMRKVFVGRAKSTVLNRLGRLEGLGVIERWKIPLLDSRAPGPGIFVVFQITKYGIRALKEKIRDRIFREKPVRLHGYSIHHDVLLVDVLDALREKFPGAAITNGKLLENVAEEKVVQPDALFLLPGGQERWAVELELSAKSEKRYREIVLRYRLSRAFDRVLYITGSREIVPKLERVLDRKMEPLGSSPPREKFLFLNLHALWPNGKSANQPESNTNMEKIA